MHPLLDLVIVLIKVFYFYIEAFIKLFVPAKKKEIRGQNVLITGGGRGIGRAMAIKFSAQGAKIILWDLDKNLLKETADELKVRGATVHTYVCDVTSYEAVKKVAGEVRRDVGDVDILVNNAGVLIGKDILSLDEKDIRLTYEVNTIAHFWTVKEFLPAMMARRSGHIVTIASMAAKTGTPLLVDYCGSKWAAYGFTEALRMEIRMKDRHADIYTTTVCPMYVNTKLIFGDEVKSRVSYKDRFGKLLEADDVADATVQGVLENKTHVYVPKSGSGVDITNGLLPAKAKLALYDFLDTSFIPAKPTK